MARNVLFTMIRRSSTSPFIDMTEGTFTLTDHLGVWCPADKAQDLDSKLLCSTPASIPHSHLISSVNIPWPQHGMGDADYILAFQKIVMPIAVEFAPELVISVSFSLCRRD